MQLVHAFGERHQKGDGPEGFAAEFLVQPGGDDPFAAVGEFLADGCNGVVEN